ncbi:MAG TPA: phospholipase D-like domain-containing protein [Vicinamibacterales bacterium]|nr:phospholipase D-like domain-containing protein [Vicinamibacterales bacterium]
MTRSGRPADQLITAVDERRAAILDVIRRARSRITLSLFRCNDQAILRELATATARGVAVDVLVTSRVKGGQKKIEKLWRALEGTGAAVKAYVDPVVKYHAKYLVADEGPAIVATLNFTRKCFRKTCDALVVTHDPHVVSGLRALWTADCSCAPMPADLPERLIVGPERARRQFTALIEEARRSIRLLDAKLSDPDLVALLNARRAAGIEVEVFSGKRAAALKSHGKILLIDDGTAVVGSLALAALSLDFRREVAIVVTEPGAVAVAIDLFTLVRDTAAESPRTSQSAGGEAQC